MSERFELLGFEKWRPQPAFDRETKQRVLLSSQRNGAFLGVASLRTMAERVVELDDPRCAKIVCTHPLAVVAPPEEAPHGSLEEWARAAVECLELVMRLRAEGILVTVGHGMGWAERREGRLLPIAFAPTFAPSFGSRIGHGGLQFGWVADVQSWLEEQLPSKPLDGATRKLRKQLKAVKKLDGERVVTAFLEALRPHLGGIDIDALVEAARASADVPARLDFDLAIEMGEAAHAEMIEKKREKWDAPLICWPLAGAYHHRGCVAWERGDREAAVRDVDRALELDPHPRYFTTRALFAEALDDPEAWRFHDAAMLAFAAPTTQREWGVESPETRQRDECRSALARAAYRLRFRNDAAGAMEDLRFVKSRWATLEGELGGKVDAFLARLGA